MTFSFCRFTFAGLGAALLVAFSAGCSDEDPPLVPIQDITAAQAAEVIAQAGPAVRPVLLYAARCPYSRAFFPSYTALAQDYSPAQDVAPLAFSVDSTRERLEQFLGSTPLPLVAYRIVPWQGDELHVAMRSVGIELSADGLAVPTLSVLRPDGSEAGQWVGVTADDDAAVRAVIEAARNP